MTMLRGAEKDRFLSPGSLVRLSIRVNECDMLEPEYGIVLGCWKNSSRGVFDCLVAFLGDAFPMEGRIEPYLSTFAAASLAVIETEG